jgi:tRNA dimethylallyltransferase
MEQKKLVVVAGPTAVGKTKLSVALAKKIGGEIISADSMQVYRGMDIGSAKIRPEEMDGVRHHLIDVLDPSEPFDVVRFQSLAKQAMTEIISRGKIPILAGGTGFYIQSVVYDIDFTENDADPSFRRMLAGCKDPAYLHAMLEKADPEAAKAIHPNNIRRTIRALEFYQKTGSRISEHNQREREKTSPYRLCYFVLTQERSRVYEKINRRVDDMLSDGLVDEVRHLKEQGLTPEMTSMKGLGYAEMLRFLSGEIPYDEAVRLIKQNTRHFAKRQLTWFRREKDVVWINLDAYDSDEEKILREMLRILSEKGIVVTCNN